MKGVLQECPVPELFLCRIDSLRFEFDGDV